MRESARRRQADTSRILVGYWRESTEPEPNQHAVYGILSRDGTLRFKVVSETRDGRPIQCKSLLSPGDSWIIHDEVVLEPHLRHLNRLEMKEYCRVRQHHIDQGEDGQDIAANIINSVELAKQIAEASYSRERPRNLRWAREKCADERRARRKLKKRLISEAAQLEHVTVAEADAEAKPDEIEAKTEAEIQVSVSQVRAEDARLQDHMMRSNSFTAIRPARSTPPVPVRESETAPPQPSAHVHAPAPSPALSSGRRDWHSVIQPHMRTVSPPIAAPAVPAPAVPAPPAPPAPPPRPPPRPPRASAPPASAPPPPPAPAPTMAPPALPTARGSKSYGGIRYDWKDTGLFTQKYVSRGCIITIDDEDYVEYRVLTKPAFI